MSNILKLYQAQATNIVNQFEVIKGAFYVWDDEVVVARLLPRIKYTKRYYGGTSECAFTSDSPTQKELEYAMKHDWEYSGCVFMNGEGKLLWSSWGKPLILFPIPSELSKKQTIQKLKLDMLLSVMDDN